jgi:hypothetical protein
VGRGTLRGGAWCGRCTVIEALTELASKLAPEVLSSLVSLARLALSGAPKAEIVSEAERLATLAAYKHSYRRD